MKAFANEREELDKFHRYNERFKRCKGQYYRAFGLFVSGTEFHMAALQLVVVAVGGYYIMRGKMDYVDLATFSLYVATFVSPIRKLTSFIELFQDGYAGFLRFLEVMRTEPEVKDAPDAVELRDVRGRSGSRTWGSGTRRGARCCGT